MHAHRKLGEVLFCQQVNKGIKLCLITELIPIWTQQQKVRKLFESRLLKVELA